MSYRILVADDLGKEGLQILQGAGEVTVKTGMAEDELRSTLPGFHALVVRSATCVTERSLELADELAVIGRAGIGVDNIDVDAATARGIVVMNTPLAGAVTTAEHAVSLLVSMARRIPQADASIRSGKWEKGKFTGVELQNKQLGVVGLGNIGRVVADRGRGLGMVVAAYDPFVTQANAPKGVRMLELDELLATSDFVTIHVPLLEETKHLINEERLQRMKPGAYLVHAARGGIVDETALCKALESGHLAGAAVDVFEKEPLAEDHPLRHTPNTILTPHLGASTKEAKQNVSIAMAEQVVLCLREGVALNGVNVARIAPSDAAQLGPYLSLVQRLGAFLVQTFPGKVQSLRLTVQGGIPESSLRPLSVGMIVGALKPGSSSAITPVNAERVAKDRNIRVHAEASSLKRDFMNLVRVEAVIDEQRHFATGTVLGHRHGRLVELDDYVIDAIPEGPLLVTFHRDRPGVVGTLGSILGDAGVNISRMQLGTPNDPPRHSDDADAEQPASMAVLNVDRPLDEALLQRISSHDAIISAVQVR